MDQLVSLEGPNGSTPSEDSSPFPEVDKRLSSIRDARDLPGRVRMLLPMGNGSCNRQKFRQWTGIRTVTI